LTEWENAYQPSLAAILEKITQENTDKGNTDLVIGIPFLNESTKASPLTGG